MVVDLFVGGIILDKPVADSLPDSLGVLKRLRALIVAVVLLDIRDHASQPALQLAQVGKILSVEFALNDPEGNGHADLAVVVLVTLSGGQFLEVLGDDSTAAKGRSLVSAGKDRMTK